MVGGNFSFYTRVWINVALKHWNLVAECQFASILSMNFAMFYSAVQNWYLDAFPNEFWRPFWLEILWNFADWKHKFPQCSNSYSKFVSKVVGLENKNKYIYVLLTSIYYTNNNYITKSQCNLKFIKLSWNIQTHTTEFQHEGTTKKTHTHTHTTQCNVTMLQQNVYP